MNLNPKLIGETFKSANPNGKLVMAALKQLEAPVKKSVAFALKDELNKNGEAIIKVDNSEGQCVDVKISKPMVEITASSKKISSEKYTPSVIEPSFGLGRILYHILEHSYYVRPDDEQRGVLALPALLAGQKVAILPISAQEAFEPFADELSRLLSSNNISSKVDASSAALGRRYARSGKININISTKLTIKVFIVLMIQIR